MKATPDGLNKPAFVAGPLSPKMLMVACILSVFADVVQMPFTKAGTLQELRPTQVVVALVTILLGQLPVAALIRAKDPQLPVVASELP